MDKNVQERKNLFKTWLETLQQESWQLELLISGLALFGIFGAKSYIDDLESFLDIQFLRGAASFASGVLLFLIKGSWYIFLINLTIHIILRGLWIGAIGLRYVSNDIDYDQLNFSSYFKKLYTRRYDSFDDYIEDLEKVCSVIFAYTFLLFFILISACLFILWAILLLAVVGHWSGIFLLFIYILFGAIVFIDFIFLNPLKKMEDKWISRIYGALFRFYSTITLSFIFRPLLLNFLDNKFTRKLFLFSLPYGIIIILILPKISGESLAYMPTFNKSGIEYHSYYAHSINPTFYDNIRKEGDGEVRYLSLKSDRITGEILEFFLTHIKADERYFESVKQIERINKVGVYSGYTRATKIDSVILENETIFAEELKAFFEEKRQNTAGLSGQEWDDKYNELVLEQKNKKYDLYESKAKRINAGIIELNQFYIDGVDISSKVDCLMSEHSNVGEKGWRCFISLDSLNNGLHRFTVKRGVYNVRNNVSTPFKLEIPFILDR